jgi:hypothetical protein
MIVIFDIAISYQSLRHIFLSVWKTLIKHGKYVVWLVKHEVKG